ncbi:hypothetical protein IR152_12655 [Clostridioides sp. ES-S-0108-01]|uniref:hypothetical protein n=1 Tax=Clostridioides sp. ES-S-0108-01 TaxID=2770773 RepID=UPI001D0C2D84|nr:hypothetical protein [Clostridioides sp. ES-S-0108-01]UDN51657.1 hypothetical protein JJC16_02955 [Clostridioides sp. ES-S-0107-01]
MKIKKSLISTMMVSAMILGGTKAVFANGNDSSNITLPKLQSLIKSGVTDPAELEKYGVEHYTYEEYAKHIQELKDYAKNPNAVKDVSKKDIEKTIKRMEQELEKIKTEGLKIMKPIVIENEDGSQLSIVYNYVAIG